MYIEPCCIDRQLPSLLKRHAGNAVFYQTSGDITVLRYLQAVSSMVDDPFTLLLVIPEIDRSTLQTIRYYHQRGWLAALLLLTTSDQSGLVKDVLGSDLLSSSQYACDPLVADGLLAFLGKSKRSAIHNDILLRKQVIIQGAMLAENDFSLSLYAGSYSTGNDRTASEKDIWQSATAAVISKLRLKPVISSEDSVVKEALEWK